MVLVIEEPGLHVVHSRSYIFGNWQVFGLRHWLFVNISWPLCPDLMSLRKRKCGLIDCSLLMCFLFSDFNYRRSETGSNRDTCISVDCLSWLSIECYHGSNTLSLDSPMRYTKSSCWKHKGFARRISITDCRIPSSWWLQTDWYRSQFFD